jgi:hypothetical protein
VQEPLQKPMPTAPGGGRALLLGIAAAVLHGACDLATFPSRWTRPPYLRIEDAPEMFHTLSPVGVSVAASAVSGVIAALAVLAVEPAPGRRARTLGIVLAAFWLCSAVLFQAVWLSTGWRYGLTSLPLALPRGLVIGWAIAALSPRRS